MANDPHNTEGNDKKIPLYRQIADQIISWISEGRYTPGSRLPSERDLSMLFGVSRITITGALKALERDNWVRRGRGRAGTEVLNPCIPRSPKPERALSRHCVKLTFGVNALVDYRPVYELLIHRFRDEYPHIEIELRDMSMTGIRAYQDPYLLAMAEGTTPTLGIFYMSADYAAANGLIPLEEMPGFQAARRALRPGLIQPTRDATGTSHVHSLPIRCGTRALIAHVGILEKSGLDPERGPQSFADLCQWGRRLGETARKLGEGTRGVHCESHSAMCFYPYMWNANGFHEIHDPEGFVDMLRGDSSWLSCLQETVQYGEPSWAPSAHLLLVLGRLGMLLSASPNVVEVLTQYGKEGDFRAYPIPPFREGMIQTTNIGVMEAGIFRAGARTESEHLGAWEFLRFLLRPDSQRILNEAFWSVPVLSSMKTSIFDSPAFAAFQDESMLGHRQYNIPHIRRLSQILAEEIGHVLHDGKNMPRNGLDRACERIRAQFS